MDFLSTAILSVVEGITEYLPVSSTAHILITERLLKISGDFALTFAIFIQGASVLAIVILYLKKILENLSLVPKVIVGFLPTAFVGFFLYDFIKGYLLESMFVIATALFVGGVVMLLVDKKEEKYKKEVEEITHKESLVLGFSQILAFIPGMSRSGSTIIVGRLVNFPRKMIIEFSFLLAIPTILGATVLDLAKTATNFSSYEIKILIFGGIVSFVTSLLVAKWLLAYLSNHSFKIFAWYRILLALFIFIFFVI